MESPEQIERPHLGRVLGAVLLCSAVGAAYVMLAGAVFGAGFAMSVAMNSGLMLGLWIGAQVGLCCGLVTGLTYGLVGGPFGVVLAGLFGGAANSMLRNEHPSPASIHGWQDIYAYFMMLVLPFFVCWGFAWLLWRAGEEDSAAPMLTGTAQLLKTSGLYSIPLAVRFALALVLGTLGAWYLGAHGAPLFW